MSRTLYLVAAGVLLLTPIPVAAINYNDNCVQHPIPSNTQGKWFAQCPSPSFDQTNWEGNRLPNSSDDVVIDASYGVIDVDGDATVQSVAAGGGLNLTSSAWSLELTLGNSFITNLTLINNSTLTAGGGVVVTLSGNTAAHAFLHGPGIFTATDLIDLNACRLRTGGVLTIDNTATLTSGNLTLMDGNTTLVNNAVFNVSDNAGSIAGGNSDFINQGAFNINVPGEVLELSPRYTQEHGGHLNVEAGTLLMTGNFTRFNGGSYLVAENAVLEHNQMIGGEQDHWYYGVRVSGDGLVDVYNEMLMFVVAWLDVGRGDPDSGVGGFRLNGQLRVLGGVANEGRFRFNHGRIYANSSIGKFFNREGAWAYTRSSGSATLNRIDFRNQGNFQLGGGGLFLEDENSQIHNEELIRVVAGDVSGLGRIVNDGIISMEAGSPLEHSVFSCRVTNVQTARAVTGILEFQDLEHQIPRPGELYSGTWEATDTGQIIFPETITKLGEYARLRGPGDSFPNVDLDEVRNGLLETAAWGNPGPMWLHGAQLTVQQGQGLSVGGALHNLEGSSTQLEPGATIEAAEINNGEAEDSVISELGGIVVLAKSGSPLPGVLDTPLFNNHGRLFPGGDGGTGSLHFTGDLVQHSGGVIDVDWAGLNPSADYDQLIVDGDVTLAGLLDVETINGYVPAQGEQITVITSTGTISGSLALNNTDGHTYSIQITANSVVLTVDAVAGPVATWPTSPTTLSWLPPFPNPASQEIALSLRGAPGSVGIVDLFDVRGRRVFRQEIRLDAAGTANFSWGRQVIADLPSGTYFARARVGDSTDTTRITLLH